MSRCNGKYIKEEENLEIYIFEKPSKQQFGFSRI
jgi:hypothetical protein